MASKGENIQICRTTLNEKTDALEQQYKYKRKSDAFLALTVLASFWVLSRRILKRKKL